MALLTRLTTAVGFAFALCLLAGCPPEEPDDDGSSEVVESETADVDGLVLMQRSDREVSAVNLIDPTTGKASAYEYRIKHLVQDAQVVAVSQDGARVALVQPEGAVLLAEVVIDDNDLPSLEPEQSWEETDETCIDFDHDTDFLVGCKNLYEPNSGDVIPCDVEAEEPQGRTCEAVHQRRDALTTDRQFGHDPSEPFGRGLEHLPSKARLRDGVMQNQFTVSLERLVRVLPDGRLGFFGAGVNGDYVVREAAGWRSIYKRKTSTATPGIVDTYDVLAAFENRRWDNETLLNLDNTLRPFMSNGEGRSFQPLGVTQNDEVIYGVSSWVIDRVNSDHSDALFERVISTAVVAITPDGAVRSHTWEAGEDAGTLPRFASVPATAHLPAPLTHHGIVHFGDDGWLAVGNNWTWAGFLGGEAVVLEEAGPMSMDGRWTLGQRYHDDRPPTLCFRKVAPGSASTCIPQPTQGSPVALVAPGVRKTQGQPVLTNISHAAAYPGQQVRVFGARFGDQGTLTLSGEAVAQANIVEWTPRRITFTVPDSMPEKVRVGVQTDAGENVDGRALWLARTELYETPFSDLEDGPHPLGQGLNRVDLGDVDFEPPAAGSNNAVNMSLDARLEDGSYVVASAGTAADEEEPRRWVTVTSGDFERELVFRLEDRLADDEHWQPFKFYNTNTLAETAASFYYLAGELVEVPGRMHPMTWGEGGRVVTPGVRTRRPSGPAAEWGLPDFWRNTDDGAWVLVAPSSTMLFRKLTGFGGPSPEEWGIPQFADSPPEHALHSGLIGLAAHEDLLLFVGYDNTVNNGGAAYKFSRDGGQTMGELQMAADALGRPGAAFREPIALERAGEPVFLVFESVLGTTQTHLIDAQGSLEPDVAVPVELDVPGGLRPFTRGSKALVYSSEDKTLLTIDLDAQDPVWTPLPDESSRGRVISVFEDRSDGHFYAVLDDGMTQRASQSSGWSEWSPFTLDIDTITDLQTRITTLGQLDDGRWVVGADVSNADGSEWPFGGAALFASPRQQ